MEMKIPTSVSKRWFGEVCKQVPTGTSVRIDRHWNFSEICTSDSYDLVATFQAEKHAVEFCQLNSLKLSEIK